MFDGVKLFLYKIRSGILQGCPASGSLFVLAIDPLLRMLRAKLAGSRTKAFADDLATLLVHLNHIGEARRCFSRFQLLSGLALKPKKCKLLALGGVEEYLAEAAPEWEVFQVTDMAEYLGFQVGYRGGTISTWTKPLKKFKSLTA